jgi:predicted transcriptional regulator
MTLPRRLRARGIVRAVAVLMLPLAHRGPGRPPIGNDPESVLSTSERRREILSLIEQQPGIHSTEIRRILDLGAGVVHHHLDKLAAAGLVETREYGHAILYYAAGQAPPKDDPALTLTPSAKRIALAVLHRPGRSSVEIAREVELYPKRVSVYLTQLQEAGLVLAAREGTRVRYVPAPKLERLSAEW